MSHEPADADADDVHRSIAALAAAADPHHEFQGIDGQINTGAGEAIIQADLKRKADAAKANVLAAKHVRSAPVGSIWRRVASLPRRAVGWPVRHIKDNPKRVAIITAGGTAGAAAIAYAGTTVGLKFNPVAVGAMVPLSYPTWHFMETKAAKLAFFYGHVLNAWHHDRFREVKTEPAGLWGGRMVAGALILSGGIFGENYLNGIYNMTLGLPHTVVSAADRIVDHTTSFNNTALDPRWELKDQPNCLFLEQTQPGRKFMGVSLNCVRKPEAEGMQLILPTGVALAPALQ